jgi:hypothetical protein
MHPDDSDYYRARAIEERWKMKESGDTAIGAIHGELAAQYDALADKLDMKSVMSGEILKSALTSLR